MTSYPLWIGGMSAGCAEVVRIYCTRQRRGVLSVIYDKGLKLANEMNRFTSKVKL